MEEGWRAADGVGGCKGEACPNKVGVVEDVAWRSMLV